MIGERRFDRERMPASRYHANRIGSRALSCFVGVPIDDTQCGFRVFRTDSAPAVCPFMQAATKSKRKCSSRCGGSAAVSQRADDRCI